MFMKALIGGVIFIALTSVAPQLGAILLIVIPIVIVIAQNKEEKAANTAEFGYDPIRQRVNDLPPEQQARVKEISDNKKIKEKEVTTQIVRNQKAIPGTIYQRLNGKADFYPSLNDWEIYAYGLPSGLKEKLMAAAKAESWESSKSRALIIYDYSDHQKAIQSLKNIFTECEAYKQNTPAEYRPLTLLVSTSEASTQTNNG